MCVYTHTHMHTHFRVNLLNLLWMSFFYWHSPGSKGCSGSSFSLCWLIWSTRSFLSPQLTYCSQINMIFFFYFSPKIFSDFGKILAMYCFMTFSQFISSFKNHTSSNNGYIFFSSVYTVLRIYFNSFLFILWHLEYGEWSVLLNSLQLNNRIHIYGANTAPSTVLSPS